MHKPSSQVKWALAPAVEPEHAVNPVLDRDFPDPSVLQVEETYYAFATNSGRTNIQVARSKDLRRWEYLKDALPALPEWAVQEFGWAWSPAVSATPEGYVMYLTARYDIGGRQVQCIAVAMSEVPEGPFESLCGEPFICQTDQGGSIDPTPFIDDDGSRYLLWKNDGNSLDAPTWIHIQRVSMDGLTLLGEPARLITADRSWEGVLVEAPTLWKYNGKYYLFYSGNHFTSSSYAIGYAVADSLWGPYRKPDKPLLATDARRGLVGPGGQDIVVGPEGATWMLYHAWSLGGCRNLNVGRLVWRDLAASPEAK